MGPIPSVSERRIPKMLSAWHGRMDRHIRLNVERGTFPVVVVAGKIANAAFAQLPIGEPLATIDVCGFLISRCLSAAAVGGVCCCCIYRLISLGRHGGGLRK